MQVNRLNGRISRGYVMIIEEEQTINKTVELDLCVSCGVCKAICPVNCIEMEFERGQFLPQINEEKCINCGNCYEVCPGISINYHNLYANDNKEIPSNIYVGNVIKTYTAWSENPEIREQGTSGGVVTALLINLIKNNQYDKAFIVEFENHCGKEVKLKPTNNIKKIKRASKSKYLPVSAEEVVNYILDKPDEKIIVVGTSCHIHGIKKVLNLKKLDSDNILMLGLFCDKTMNFNFINYYRDKFIDNKSKIKEFHYRNKEYKGWPGDTKIKLENGKEIFVDRRIRMELKTYFQLTRCFFCIDKLNQFSDISFGDCYINNKKDRIGKSNFIIRTTKGEKVIEEFTDNIALEKADLKDILISQKIKQKKNNLNFAKGFKKVWNIYPDLIEEESSMQNFYFCGEKVDYDYLTSKLNSIKDRFKFGQNYNSNPEKFNEIDPIRTCYIKKEKNHKRG